MNIGFLFGLDNVYLPGVYKLEVNFGPSQQWELCMGWRHTCVFVC